LKKKLAVFRAGNYPQGDWPVERVAKAVAAYDPGLHRAPLTDDHRQQGPAFGWFDEFFLEGDRLFTNLDTDTITPEGFAEIQSGRWGPPSIEFYPEDHPANPVPGTPYIKAVTMLGAKPPQIKGLDPVRFSEAELRAIKDEGTLDGIIIFEEEPPDLDTLKIAAPLSPWDEAVAKQRVKDRFGWWGLGRYSLYRDFKKHWETLDSYYALVVDVVANEPQIVPAAVDAAIAAIPTLPAVDQYEKQDRAAALERAKEIKKRIEKEQTTVGFCDPRNNPGGKVNKEKLLKFFADLAKGKIPEAEVASFAEQLTDLIFTDNPDFAKFKEPTATTFAEQLFEAKLEAYKAKAEAGETKAKLAASFAERQKAQFAERVAKLISAGKFLPANKDRLVNALAAISGENAPTVQFSEAGKTETRPAADEILALFEALPKFVPDGEIVKPDDKEHARFSEHVEAGKKIAEAVNPPPVPSQG